MLSSEEDVVAQIADQVRLLRGEGFGPILALSRALWWAGTDEVGLILPSEKPHYRDLVEIRLIERAREDAEERVRNAAQDFPQLSLLGSVKNVPTGRISRGRVIRRPVLNELVIRPQNFADFKERQLPPRDQSDAD